MISTPKRLVEMIKALLMQGLTPSGVSLSLMLGGAGAVFPVLGTTTMVTGLFSMCFRLNHAIVQAINILATPLQLVLILPLLRVGEWVFGVEGISLSLVELTASFREAPGAFFRTFASSFVHVVTGWFLTVLPAALVGHLGLRVGLANYAHKLRVKNAASIPGVSTDVER